MSKGNQKEEQEIRSKEAGIEASVSRRTFLQILGATPVLGAAPMLSAMPIVAAAGEEKAAGSSHVCFTSVDHWHQTGAGWFLREGYMNGKRYEKAYSCFYTVQKTVDAIHRFPFLTACLEFDSHGYEAMQQEDPQFVAEVLRPAVASGRIEPVGGTYAQPYGQIVGWQSNVRHLVDGRAIARDVLGKEVQTFLVEEIIFYPQVPQLLKLCGFSYASLAVQNNGGMPLLKKAVVNWRGLDGSTMPTIPNNPWMISLTNQYQSLARFVDATAEEQHAMLTMWAEVWPPGMDWGASYLPYTQGYQSLRDKGLQSLCLTDYMRRRCEPGTKLDSVYWKMDDGFFNFGWPQNKGALWETLGGWGYEGDALLKRNRRMEHQLNAAEMLLALAPDADRSKRLHEAWKTLMRTQCHDCFIVSGFPGEYDHVWTTNLEITRMMNREVESSVRQLRAETIEHLAAGSSAESVPAVICQNPAGAAVRQPIKLEIEATDESHYSLASDEETVELQRVNSAYANENPKLVGVVDLPACGIKSYALRKGAPASESVPTQSGEIANEFYSVKWDTARKGFAVHDTDKNRTVLFRPFSGEIVHIKESWWAAPNNGAKFRAKDFSEVTYKSAVEASGPVCQVMVAKGNILTFNTTDDPGAWVTARAVLYKGIRRVDVVTELHTNPNMQFRALAELEVPGVNSKIARDFPFGEEESHKEQFSALNYVRLQSTDFAMVLAHGGTQQFFCVRTPEHVLLRNMIARLTLKGSYRWNWSITTGSSFTPAESYRFSEASWGPIVQRGPALKTPSQSWVSVDDPALVIFRLGADSERLTVWLMNYSSEAKQGALSFTAPVRACRRVNMEGNPMAGGSAELDESGKSVKLNLAPWEIAALDIERG